MADPLYYGIRDDVYLDYASLAPPTARAIEAMKVAAEQAWGNPHSRHDVGFRALDVLERARQRVTEYCGAGMNHEIVFTAGGRGAIERGLPLAFELARKRPGPIVCNRLEHPELIARFEQIAAAEKREISWLSLPAGVPTDEDRDLLRTASLVAVSACNHELGTQFPIDDISAEAVRFIDATQAAPWMSLKEWADERTFLAFSGAKLGAPLGVGVLRVPHFLFYSLREKGISIESSSPPWLSAIGLGAACAERVLQRGDYFDRAVAISKLLLDGMRELEPDLVLNGDAPARLGPIVNVSFPNVEGKGLAHALSSHGVCISHTAACRSGRDDASPVVRAAYPGEPERAVSATRWSVSEKVTEEDVRTALTALQKAITMVRPRH